MRIKNLLSFFIYFIPFKRKKEWFLNELKNSNIKFKSFFGFFLIDKEDKEFLDYLLPDNFLLMKDSLFTNNISSQGLELAFKKKLSGNDVFLFLDFINYISEQHEFDFNFKINSGLYKIVIFYKDNKDIVFDGYASVNEINVLLSELKDFIYSDLRVGRVAYENIKRDLFSNYLSGFDISFEDYSMTLIKNDEDNFSIILENEKSLKKIIVNKAKINEKTGLISFAGEEHGCLFF